MRSHSKRHFMASGDEKLAVVATPVVELVVDDDVLPLTVAPVGSTSSTRGGQWLRLRVATRLGSTTSARGGKWLHLGGRRGDDRTGASTVGSTASARGGKWLHLKCRLDSGYFLACLGKEN